jgi:GNAT superfamily N-acetyltransferase
MMDRGTPIGVEAIMAAFRIRPADVRRAGPADQRAVAGVLAAAFADDPVFSWVFPDPGRRAVGLPRFFALVVDTLAHHDDIWTTAPAGGGGAVWVPCGRPEMPADREEPFTVALAELAGQDAERMLALMAVLDEHTPAEPQESLWFLGVAPHAQGQGIGSALLAPVLDRADRAGVPAYLEATSARNKTLYERHGFVAEPPIAVPGGPPLWPMWRRPRNG